MTREKMRNKKFFVYLGAIMIGIIVVAFYAYNVIAVELYQNQIEAENKALISQKLKLEEELKNVSNPKYIEQQARTQLRMIFPGEILYVLPEKTEESNGEN